MTEKRHKRLFLAILILLLLVMCTPLDYVNLSWAFVHFGITVTYAAIILIHYSKKKENQQAAVIVSAVLLPITGVISIFILIVSPTDDVTFTKVPNSRLVVTSQYHSLFMQGNPTYNLVIGYRILGNFVIWRKNDYFKRGYEEDEAVFSEYILPNSINFEEYQGAGMFILEDENYLFDWANDTIYPIKRKEE